VNAGANQYGFSQGEDAAMRTQATEQNAAAGRNASNATRSALASVGGGNTLLPNGSSAAINAGLAEDQAQKQAESQLAITQKGYDVGRQNFFGAEQALAAAPGELEAPISQAGSVASGAASNEMEGGTAITQANQAWVAPVAGMIGAIGGAAASPAPK